MMEITTFKRIVREKQAIIKAHQDELNDLIRECPHEFRDKMSAYCSICKRDFGWYCPKSPDHTCYYYSDNGFVELRNGEKVPVPEGHDKRWESYDCCVFCNEPDERK